MIEFLSQPVPQALLWTALGLIMAALGLLAISAARKPAGEQGSSASDLLSGFRDLHDRGELDDEEYRQIKQRLGAQLREQVKAAERTTSDGEKTAEPTSAPADRPGDNA